MTCILTAMFTGRMYIIHDPALLGVNDKLQSDEHVFYVPAGTREPLAH